jgi:hypothetical protein
MKIHLLAAVALALSLPLAGAAPKEDSLISAFKGAHNGTLVFSGISGTTYGSFSASKKKEMGTFTLQTSISPGGTPYTLTEQFIFNKRSVTWSLSQSGDGSSITIPGAGTAKISKNKISYTIPVNFMGAVGTVFGTMKIAKNGHVTVQETLSIYTGSAVLLYQLGGKKLKQ